MIGPATTASDAAGILRARARKLAIAPRAASSGPVISVVEFTLADERYAVEMSYVSEIHPLEHLTPVPCTPPIFRGIINVRGRLVAVVDVKRFFDLPDKGITDLHRVVVVQHEGIEVGLLADFVVGTRIIPLGELQPPLPTLTGIRADYLKGITAERVIVLDAGRILGDPKLIVNEEPRA